MASKLCNARSAVRRLVTWLVVRGAWRGICGLSLRRTVGLSRRSRPNSSTRHQIKKRGSSAFLRNTFGAGQRRRKAAERRHFYRLGERPASACRASVGGSMIVPCFLRHGVRLKFWALDRRGQTPAPFRCRRGRHRLVYLRRRAAMLRSWRRVHQQSRWPHYPSREGARWNLFSCLGRSGVAIGLWHFSLL